MKDRKILKNGCSFFQIPLEQKQEEQFERYYELLVEWNKVMNLTGITEYNEVMQKHFVDSLALVKGIKLEKINRIIDIGTGAGFPGIPLKIMFPHIEIVLLDSLKKRIKFLDCVIEDLGLEKIETIHGRAEDYAKKEEYRETFDLSVSRAVANLSSLSEYCIPYVKQGGSFISYKSGNIEEELKEAERAIKILGGKQKEVFKFQLPDSDIERSLVIIEKKGRTPKKYPRKSGLPIKEPIKV